MLLAVLNDCDEEEIEQVAENSICCSSMADVIPATSRLSSIEAIMSGEAGRDRLPSLITQRVIFGKTEQNGRTIFCIYNKKTIIYVFNADIFE